MKKILICMLILLSGVFGVISSVGIANQGEDTNQIVETIAKIETVDAAVANTTEVQTVQSIQAMIDICLQKLFMLKQGVKVTRVRLLLVRLF